MAKGKGQWQFWIDRGGTFTDIVALAPEGTILTHKLLSEVPERYEDASLQGIRDLMGLPSKGRIPAGAIDSVRMGTTVATNALLERRGEPTLLCVTKGFGDVLRIGYQDRPDIFAREIILPSSVYHTVLEIDERVDARGRILREPDMECVRSDLNRHYRAGIRSVAIVLMHGWRYNDHERLIEKAARETGFPHVSLSSVASPVMKLVSRGDTTVVDAYLSPILFRYVKTVSSQLRGSRLMFMQSNGGLAEASHFHGKDSILSGPAGGVIGMIRTTERLKIRKVIGFDMGGTSTDISHYHGELERVREREVAGVRLRAPMMLIQTVAAGGGSILRFDGSRYRVGPQSAGANPGPACYRRGGPLTVTDANLMMGRLDPDSFPKVFGPEGNQALDRGIVEKKFIRLAAKIRHATGNSCAPEEVAEGFLKIAVENMAMAVKEISVARGYNVTEYTLCCFGGAGGQHACRVADALGIQRVLLHPHAGVLSAVGIGLADTIVMRERSVEKRLCPDSMIHLKQGLKALSQSGREELLDQGVLPQCIKVHQSLQIKYEGTDTALKVRCRSLKAMKKEFESLHLQFFGYTMPGKGLVVETLQAEAVGSFPSDDDPFLSASRDPDGGEKEAGEVRMFTMGRWHDAPLYRRERLSSGKVMPGPSMICERNGTVIVEPGWSARILTTGEMILERQRTQNRRPGIGTQCDPVMLEVFNNLFMSIATQMGRQLEKTACSTNIKERLDFSCALFDPSGRLIANAPHIPVHLGAMGESVRGVIRDAGSKMRAGHVYVTNDPYNGGSHLPDITVVTPVFDDSTKIPLFFVASRGHHADIGGITPGSMPPDSNHIDQEGVMIHTLLLVSEGRFMEKKIRKILESGPYPARNPAQNLADLKAQIAANEKGVLELRKMVTHFGLETVHAYMNHCRANAEASIRRVVKTLKQGKFTDHLDNGARIKVHISVDRNRQKVIVDFTGTSPQTPDNLNAPLAVTRAAILYVFRILADDSLPLNEGCMNPLQVVIPRGCLLNPEYPAAVAGGNVETSMRVVDVLLGALRSMGAAQGTMNNLTFGNENCQYYETIAGGSGAGPGFAGQDAVHTHMTNTRITDPEVLEWRYPVLLEEFSIRHGSGGKGKFKGGNGVRRRIRFLGKMRVGFLSERRIHAPYGMNGGHPGAKGKNVLIKKDGTLQELPGKFTLTVEPGEGLEIQTPGGGGYGKGIKTRGGVCEA